MGVAHWMVWGPIQLSDISLLEKLTWSIKYTIGER